MTLEEIKQISPFAMGRENVDYTQYFDGTSYLNMISLKQVIVGNVTFEPACRNHWHIHHASQGGGQMLLVTVGRGWYQEWGKPAQALHAGDVILLDGDLGAGKTTFTKGLARGLGIRKNVKSPTFTLIREYHEGRLPLYHMDVYRLEETGGDDLGLEEYFNGDGVSVVEWSQFVEDDLPKEFLIVHFIKDETDDDKRTLVFEPRGKRYEEMLKIFE